MYNGLFHLSWQPHTSTQPYMSVLEAFIELIFPSVLRKMRRFSFRHNGVPVQWKAPTGQWGLDWSQRATVTFRVCTHNHRHVLMKILCHPYSEHSLLSKVLCIDFLFEIKSRWTVVRDENLRFTSSCSWLYCGNKDQRLFVGMIGMMIFKNNLIAVISPYAAIVI